MSSGTLSRGLLLLKELDELGAVLDAAGVPWLALKGAVLAQRLYASPALRPMEDLDLLVRPGSLGAAEAVLRARGFEPVPGTPTDWRRGGLKVDLEDGLWYLDRRGLDAFWERSGEADGLRAPSWEDHFVLTVAHCGAHHAFWDPAHAEDLRLFLERDLDWPLASRLLAEARMGPVAAASLELLGLRAPPGLRLPVGSAESRALLRLIRREGRSGEGHLLRWWTAPDRGAHLLRWLFPGRAFLERRYALPWWAAAPLRPLLLAKRLLER